MAIRIKNQSQIDRIKKAGDIVAKCFEIVKANLHDDMTTLELDKLIGDTIRKNGGTSATKGYGGFPGEACISVNEELIHGIPNRDKVIHNGDIVSCDIMAWYDGCVADACRTFACGDVDPETKRLMDVTKQSFFEAMKVARAGHHLNEIGQAIEKYCEDNGCSVVRDFVGHGVGLKVHEEPEVPNYDTGKRGPVLQKGMVIAVEPMVSLGDYEVDVLDDD